MTGQNSDAVGVLDRMTQILGAFDQHDHDLGLSELARRSGLPKSTVSRLVATLVRHGYLERDGRLIHLGLRVFELGQLAREPRELRAVALPVMLQLRDRTGENVHLAIRDGREMVCIAALRGRSEAPSAVRVGARLPAHATALGKIMLAHSPPVDSPDPDRAGLPRWTPSTITDERILHRQLAEVRSSALATEQGEFEVGVSCAASAVFDARGDFVGAMSLSGRSRDFVLERVASPLRAAAQTLTRRLSATAPGR